MIHDHRSERGKALGLNYTLHAILRDVAPAQHAAMVILMHHLQVSANLAEDNSTAGFAAAAEAIHTCANALRNIEAVRLAPLQIRLPDDLSSDLAGLSSALGDLQRILERCSVDADKGVRGFRPVEKMHDLCATRISLGIAGFCAGLGTLFLDLSEKGKAEELNKTSTIAMEIGKIGRVINMVATNASIEAARAGEAGKGFTLIADEVKVLSSRVSSLSVSLTDRLH